MLGKLLKIKNTSSVYINNAKFVVNQIKKIYMNSLQKDARIAELEKKVEDLEGQIKDFDGKYHKAAIFAADKFENLESTIKKIVKTSSKLERKR